MTSRLAPSISPELYHRARLRLAETGAAMQEQALYLIALDIQREDLQQLQQQLYQQGLLLAQTREQLHTNARMLDAIQAIANIGSLELDVRSREVLWSPQTYLLHETTPEEYQPRVDLGMQHYLPEYRAPMAAALQKAINTGEPFDLEVEKYTLQGRKIDVRTTCIANRNSEGELVHLTGIFQDISERKQAERYQQHHSRILELLLEKAPLDTVLNAIAKDLENIAPDSLCCILLFDSEHNRLVCRAAPSLPDFFIEAINNLVPGPSTGSCGHSIYSKTRSIAADLQQHPLWQDFRELTARAGLGACWSEPIHCAEGKVLGTLALYYRAPRTPNADDLALIEREAHLAALAIQQCQVEEQFKLTAQVFSHAREAILVTDADGRIMDVNPAFSALSGYSRDEALGKTPRLLQSGYHSNDFFTLMWQQLWHNGAWNGELWNRHKNGSIYVTSMNISAVRNSRGEIISFVGLFNDISDAKEHQRQLERAAHYDALTSLPNRVLLADRLKQAMFYANRHGRLMAVLYLDLDGFKAVNDLYGHAKGDQLLVAVAMRLKAVLRESDTLARMGGDEFVLVLNDLETPNDLHPLLQRLLKAAAEPVLLDDTLVSVSASIGATFYPLDNADAEQLLRHADQAMYMAKQKGKNDFHYFDIAHDLATRQLYASSERLHLALSAGEFELYYQPKVNMASGEIIGVEALLRWRHPERGLLGPCDFLSSLSNHPFSIELGDWVLNRALSDLAQLQQQGLQLNISINVSTLHLLSPDFIQALSHKLHSNPSVKPQQLELEIVETSALTEIDELIRVMRECIDLGVHFAMDDFGTGYASLTHLKRLPANTLKIDRSFVRDMLEDSEELAIVEGIISLALTFKRKVIAEGVETQAQGEKLIALGCLLGQGYGIAHPMPLEQLRSWQQHWQPSASWRSAGEQYSMRQRNKKETAQPLEPAVQ